MRIAVYSCNFGNYRNELTQGIDGFVHDKDIDYFFFTDSNEFKSEIWKIIQVPLLNADGIMNPYRWTAKYIKFVLPEILSDYNIVIWCDSKILKMKFMLHKENILNLCHDHKIVNCKHPQRKTLHEELQYTISRNIENVVNGRRFQEEIIGRSYSTPLPDTCFIIRTTDKETNTMMARVFELLKEKGLKRDQNVYNHAIDELQYPVTHIRWICFKYNPGNTGTPW